LAFRWDFRRSGLFFQTRPGSYNDVSLIGFLNELKRHFGGRRLILVWDGLPSHKSRAMATYLQAQRSWLTVERLPGYAPDLNPTNSCGATSRGANWPTSARTISARSSGRSARASGAFDGRPRWRSRFSAMRAFLCDQDVTVLRETQ
jgi:DDE superfamily endonuclease